MSRVCKNCGSDSLYTGDLMDDFQGILTCSRCKTKNYPEKPQVTTHCLYTTADVKKVREFLAEEQEGKDALTGLPLPVDKRCLDHDHKTQLVRGVLHRQVNAALGKLEGVHTRYLSTWFDGTLPDFLRLSADYLEKSQEEPDTRWYHNGWLRRISISFNQLSEGQKKLVLVQLGQPEGKNSKERKELFRKISLDRQHGFEKLSKIINSIKDQP